MKRSGLLSMLAKLSLAAFSLLAVVNFFWLTNDTVNFTLLLTSGILINVHSIVSTVRIVREKSDIATSIDSAWFHCIVAGCFVLLLCQIFDYRYGKNAKSDFLSTIGTSCMSFFSTLLLYATSSLYRYRNESEHLDDEEEPDRPRHRVRRRQRNQQRLQQQKQRRREQQQQQHHQQQQQQQEDSTSTIITIDTTNDNNDDDNDDPFKHRHREIVFVDREKESSKKTLTTTTTTTTTTTKTTRIGGRRRRRRRSRQNFDLTKYSTLFREFVDKRHLPYVQSMYETMLHTDFIWQMYDKRNDNNNDYYYYYYEDDDDDDNNDYDDEEENNDDDDDEWNVVSYDQCIVSQFAQALLFHFDGARKDPSRFARDVDEAVFDDRNFRDTIAFVYRRWFDMVGRVSGDRKIRVEWLKDSSVVASSSSSSSSPPLPTSSCTAVLAKRTLEIVRPDWNLNYYVANQNHIFVRLKNIICGGGSSCCKATTLSVDTMMVAKTNATAAATTATTTTTTTKTSRTKTNL